MKTYWYDMRNDKGKLINPHLLEVEAKDLGHALQKIAAVLSDHCVGVTVSEKASKVVGRRRK